MASKKLINGKSPSIDNMHAEYIKYAPGTTHQTIADILRKSVEADEYLQILKEGIPAPLQKPPKKTKKGEKKTINLRSAILLSTVRKTFTICIIEQTWGKLKDHIPKDQAAYQKGRNTTEQVTCMRLLIGKAITSENYNLIIMMIDTSKTLDTVNRKTLLKTLETILDESEMRMMYLLINNIKRKVKVGRSL